MQMIRHCIDQCWDVLQTVSDPEIPVLSVVDLGMIRGVEINDQQEIIVRLTPTYSGCPATDMLKAQIVEAFTAEALTPVKVMVDCQKHGPRTGCLKQGKKTASLWHCTT